MDIIGKINESKKLAMEMLKVEKMYLESKTYVDEIYFEGNYINLTFTKEGVFNFRSQYNTNIDLDLSKLVKLQSLCMQIMFELKEVE